ncbi:MAG: FKBP-type peptidyl-prolyl cis-trans isomerase [Candidatus Aminicenantes bacterium]|nr:MAG: FKBP-type peptidyl-prolyl cis-trans isomerase [Candidatus Aminicenantes bacterium]
MVLFMAVNVGCTNDSGSPDKEITLETLKQKASYGMGYNIGVTLKMREIIDEVELDLLLQGIKDGALKEKGLLEEKELRETLQTFYQELQVRQQEKRKILGEKNKVEGEKFLKENATKEGVIVTESGLQYKVLKEGTGPQPKATDTVKVHYIGTLIDGTEFDSSFKRGEAAKFPLNRVIPAWTEGVQLMKVGSKYKFFCPAELGYKERGQGPIIGPNAVLIFEVELLGIEPPRGLTPPPTVKKEETKPAPKKKEPEKKK